MADDYDFVCVSCLEIFNLGKIVTISEADERMPMRFGGWTDLTTSTRLSGAYLFQVLERWLILHRGHELRVVPGIVLEMLDLPEDMWIDSAEQVMSRLVAPEPDPEQDAGRIPADVAQRILEKLKGRG